MIDSGIQSLATKLLNHLSDILPRTKWPNFSNKDMNQANTFQGYTDHKGTHISFQVLK